MKTYSEQLTHTYHNIPISSLDELTADQIEKNGYGYNARLFSKKILDGYEWVTFKNSWNNLTQDQHMKDGGSYRYRRYSVLSWDANQERIIMEPHQPHYQTLDYNTLNGGVFREFDPFEPHIVQNKCFEAILDFSVNCINQLTQHSTHWHIEAHQFRIVCDGKRAGNPTPEGIHRDGRDFVLIMFIDRKNVKGGKTTLYDLDKNALKDYTMSYPSEIIMLNNHKLYHDVSAIEPHNPNEQSHRDVLVITFISKSHYHLSNLPEHLG